MCSVHTNGVHTYYVNQQQRERRGEDVSVLGANDAAGLNVTVWE
jgi:hypothetical protein